MGDGERSVDGTSRPLVSVVVPAHRVAGEIRRQLDAVGPQVVACAGEIVVVDDASPDGTGVVAAAWAAEHPEVRCTVVRARSQGGANASRNAGVHFAGGDVLAFTDGDDVVRAGWLAALRAAVRPGVIATGHFAWPGSAATKAVAPFFGIDLPMVLGSAMALPRPVFDAVGGFDEAIFRGGSESEFVLQACLARGATVVTVPAAVVEYHVPPGRTGRRRRRSQMQRGFAMVARRVRAIPGAPRSTFTARARARDAAGAAARVVVGGGAGRAESWDRLIVDLVGVGWIVRFARACPPRRGADAVAIAASYEVLVGPSLNAVPGG